MIELPLVSIVIPAFNPRYFAMALQSAVLQTQQRLEVVVSDDSEGDEIEAMVAAVQVPEGVALRYERNASRLGFAQNLVHALELARGDFVKVLCDDDRLFPLCVERQVQVLQAHDDVTLVLAQRMFADASNYVLPMRLNNARFASIDSLFNGGDMLALLDGRPLNFLGNFSGALLRREPALALLHALTQAQNGFVALLDQALFCCLLRRGNFVMLSDVLLIERLHPERLSNQAPVIEALAPEWGWLQQMLSQRGSEAPPAVGWVRYVTLDGATDARRDWQEMNMVLLLSNWQTCMLGRIGSDCDSYEQLYQQWLAGRQLNPAQRRQLPRTIQSWPRQPRIKVLVIDADGREQAVRHTLDSLNQQLYGAQACIVLSNMESDVSLPVTHVALESDWPRQLNQLLKAGHDADWVYLLRAGDRLSESALLLLAERIAVLPGLMCVYGDEGAWVDGLACEPVFKPDFNIDLMRSYPYVGRALAFDCNALNALGGLDPSFGELAPHDLLWRMVEAHGPQVIEHIAELQMQSELSFAQWLSQEQVIRQSPRIVSAHLDRMGVAHCMGHGTLPLLNRVEYLHSEQPLVSILVSCGTDLGALQQCVMSLMERTVYPRYELLLLAEDGMDPPMAAWLAAMTEVGNSVMRVLGAGLGGDAATLINAASRQALGDYLVMVAADLQVADGQWLSELLLHAQRPEVAVVGGRVLNESGKLVHAGIVLGVNDSAGPVCVGEDGHGRGYLQRLQVVQNWSAVSGACMMVRRALFEELGGLDTPRFSSGLAEIDLCMRAGSQGYLVVWTPYATLHSQARELLQVPVAERQIQEDAFSERWLPAVARDPAYNPNLNLMFANFSLDPGQQGGWSPFCARAVPSVLALPVNASAVGQYRVIQPFHELEMAGHIVGRVAYEVPSVVQLARIDPDVIVVQLRHNEETVRDIGRMARFSNARRIFEIDDYVVSTPKKNSHARNKPSDIEQHLRKGISLCDRVVVTTQALADVLSDMHQDIRVVPNMLDPERWAGLRSHRAISSKPRVGWGGGTSHGGDLEIIAEVVRELAAEVEWVFFGMCPDVLKPYVHEFHPLVGLQAYPSKLASLNLDLALAPLEFHVFNDCKSNLRLLEYGACGYPVICTDTAAYRGDLPCTRVRSNSTREWVDAIRMHLHDPDASYRSGDELREAVQRNFMLRADNLQHWQWGWLAD
ncbi:glycosyltransferase [Pseudomonas putida]|uniref:glycosyltransferase n=1 Tax=Pseudomonas putida TaxID=303 RepID=UPI000648B58A|nr:glycosyltransferase [Pseudomonas putida]